MTVDRAGEATEATDASDAISVPDAVHELGHEDTAASKPKPARPRALPIAWDHGIESLYDNWFRRVCAAEVGHRRYADRLYRWHVVIGVPIVILSTLVATSAFASIAHQESVATWVKVLIGSIGILAAVLSSLQTFLGYAKRSEGHRIAAVRYESLRRDMSRIQALPRDRRPDAGDTLRDTERQMDRYATQSPQFGEGSWRKLASEFDIPLVPPPIA